MLKDFTKEKFDIVIQAGQSNSEGYGLGEVASAFEPDERIWYLNQDRTISTASERVSGNFIVGNFSLTFARKYIDSGMLKEGRKLLIIRAAVGGTGFSDNRWKPEDDLFLQMTELIETAKELNPENRFVALLWHQGENDAILNADEPTHCKNLMTLVRLTRQAAGDEELPFIAADFVSDWKNANAEICEPVIRAIKSVCKECGKGMFVETEGLKSNAQTIGGDDTIHFSRESLYILGEKYFDAFSEVCKGAGQTSCGSC